MRFRIPTCLFVCGFVYAMLSPGELLAQNAYHWNRTGQVSRAGSNVRCPGDFATDNTGNSNADVVAAAAEAAGADEEGNSGYVHADGSGELNPDGQAALSWSFIHNQYFTVLASPMGYAGFWVAQGTSVDTSAVLAEDLPGEGALAELLVNIGWESGKWRVWQKYVNIDIDVGSASLTITGDQWGDFQAFGIDSDDMMVYKLSSSPLESTTGSLTFGPGEFTVPVQAGTTARIIGNVMSQVSEYGVPANTQDSDAEIFQGVITINVQ